MWSDIFLVLVDGLNILEDFYLLFFLYNVYVRKYSPKTERKFYIKTIIWHLTDHIMLELNLTAIHTNFIRTVMVVFDK